LGRPAGPALCGHRCDARATFTSTQRWPLYGTLTAQTGEFYSGTNQVLGGSLTWRPRVDFNVEATLQHNDVSLPSGAFAADLAGLRVKYSWSTTLFGSAFLQYNTQTRSRVVNARVAWRWAPLSDVFLVYTERENTLTRVRNERSVAFKVTRMLAF